MKYQLEVTENKGDNFQNIIFGELQKSFKNEEQFNSQIDTICLGIAAQFNLKYTRDGSTLIFNCIK